MALDITVGTKVWVMFNNKPVELIVTKNINTTFLNNVQEVETKIESFASYSDKNQNEHKINIDETFANRAELEAFVFNNQ